MILQLGFGIYFYHCPCFKNNKLSSKVVCLIFGVQMLNTILRATQIVPQQVLYFSNPHKSPLQNTNIHVWVLKNDVFVLILQTGSKDIIITVPL